MQHQLESVLLWEKAMTSSPKLSSLQGAGVSLRQIATIMARSASTISREIARNKTKTKGYEPSYAQEQTAGRRWRGSKLEHHPALREAVLDRLAMDGRHNKPQAGWRKRRMQVNLVLLSDA